MSKIVGERLREAILHRGVSGLWLAERAGVSASLISRVLNGHDSPRLETLQAIAPVLNVTVAWLIGEPTAQLAPHEVRIIREALRILRRLEDVP